MALWHLDVQYRYTDYSFTIPQYYWTNVYSWLQGPTDHAVPDYILALEDYLPRVIPAYTVFDHHRYRCPASGYENIVGLGEFGTIPGELSSPLWTDVVLARMYSTAGAWCGYKRFRGPWDKSRLSAGVWVSSLVSALQVACAAVLDNVPLCNYSGVSIGSVVVDNASYHWQQRHGTNRRARSVIV